MFDLLISIFSTLLNEYRTRRFLKTRVNMRIGDRVLSAKELLHYYDLAAKQALLRQIYGAASEGGRCRVEFRENGEAVVRDL